MENITIYTYTQIIYKKYHPVIKIFETWVIMKSLIGIDMEFCILVKYCGIGSNSNIICNCPNEIVTQYIINLSHWYIFHMKITLDLDTDF